MLKQIARKGIFLYRDLKAIKLSSVPQIPKENNSLKLVGFVKCFNEGTNGNLERCLHQLSIFCNDIVVCDDSSTDNSLEIVKKYTSNIIQMPNEFKKELYHKQKLLELALSLNPDWIVFLDPDEIFDRNGELGGIRSLCHYGNKHKIDSFSFLFYNLWKGKENYRVDERWNDHWRPQLWKNNGNLRFEVQEGLHFGQYPSGLKKNRRTDIKIIHYGFSSEEKVNQKYEKYSNHGQTGYALERIKDENSLKVKKFEKEWFPLSVLESKEKKQCE